MRLDVTIPKDLGKGNLGFTVVEDGGASIIPGFRVYMGQIQAPMRKSKTSWFPMKYYDREHAGKLYDKLSEHLSDTQLSGIERAIGSLVYDTAMAERFDIV